VKKVTTTAPAQLDAMFSAVVASAKAKFGADVVVGSASEISQVGLPLPALALRYMFQANIFPLGRVWQLAGLEGSCKSALLIELMRWHMLFGGGGFVAENENKDAEVLRHGVLEYNDDWISKRLAVIHTDSLNGWQAVLTQQIDVYAALMDKKGGPGRTVPIAMGVDSLTATDTQANIDKVSKDGFASRGYSEQANLISRYMRSLVSRMRNYPFSVIGTNHMKPATDYLGRPTHNIPGGKAVPFMATFMIESTRITDIDTENYAGIRLGLKMAKNSMGPSRRWIEVEFLWWWGTDPETGLPRQNFYWDWDTASIEMLLAFEDRIKGKKTLFKQIQAITGLEPIKSKKKAFSKVLGLPTEADAIPYRDFARLLESREDLMSQIYPLLGIAVYPYFKAGVDFRDSQAIHRQQTVQASASLYSNTAMLPQIDANAVDPQHTAAAEADEDVGVAAYTDNPEGE
jgi:RecA/RadA recombinase